MVVIPKKTNNLEFEEVASRLQGFGWGNLLELLLDPDSIAYTKNGRLNKSAICRELSISSKELDEALEDFRREFT